MIVPIFALRNAVFFPGGVLPLTISRPQSIAVLVEAVKTNQPFGVLTQRNAEDETPQLDALYGTGTLAELVKLVKQPDGSYSVVLKALSRFRVTESVADPNMLRARIESVPSEGTAPMDELRQTALAVIAQMPELPPAATELVMMFSTAGELADMMTANVDATLEEKQRVLEEPSVPARVKLAIDLLRVMSKRLGDDPARAARSLVVLPIDGVLFPERFLGGVTEEHPWLLERAPRYFGVMTRRQEGVGTLVELYRHPDPSVGVLLRGLSRFRTREVLDHGPPMTLSVELLEEAPPSPSAELSELSNAVLNATMDVIGIVGGATTDERDHYRKLAETKPGALADAAAAKVLEGDTAAQHSVLACHDAVERLRLVRGLVEKRHKRLVWKARLGPLGGFL